MPAYLRAQSNKKLSILTWNIADQEALFKEEFADFQKANPGVEIEWLDKKGPDLPAFYQTQLVAGTAPDIVDLQGALWVEWAANGALLDLTPYLQKEPERRQALQSGLHVELRLRQEELSDPVLRLQDAAVLQQAMFKEAGPVGAAEELRRDHQLLASHGQGREDRVPHPEFRLAVLAAVQDERHRAADARTSRSRPSTRRRPIAVLERLAKATESGGINKIAWTGRWVEPNGAFASGTVGMLHAHSAAYFFVKGQGRWINPDTLGAVQAPGNWSTPTNHGFAISKASKNPDLAFALIKHMTGNKWATKLAQDPPRADRQYRGRQGRTGAAWQAEDPLALRGVADPDRAHRQDDRQLAAAERRPDQGCVLARNPERACSGARMPRPRLPTPNARSRA